MTTYYFELGYCAQYPNDEEAWARLQELVRAICDHPERIIVEARRLGAPEHCNKGVCRLEESVDNYRLPYGDGPVEFVEATRKTPPAIRQWCSTGCDVKYAVRRAFVRLVIENAHRENIEVNLTVG